MGALANVSADATAWLLQRSAARSVHYGDELRFSGQELPGPTTALVPTRHGAVSCDVYQPASDPVTDRAREAAPVYLHLHGGAFVMRHPRMDDWFARIVAAEVGAVVVNVDYDVAPQARFPVAQHEAHDVLAWLAQHAGRLGGDPNRIAVGGFSAGGNLAASACLQARDAGTPLPRVQVLGVPSLDVAEPVDAKTSVHPSPMITPELLRLVRRTYFRDEAGRRSPVASPLLADDLAGLPPALVLTAEYDLLRREGDAYAVRLREAGVEVEHRVEPGADHYFLHTSRTRARRLLDVMTATLRRRLDVAEDAEGPGAGRSSS